MEDEISPPLPERVSGKLGGPISRRKGQFLREFPVGYFEETSFHSIRSAAFVFSTVDDRYEESRLPSAESHRLGFFVAQTSSEASVTGLLGSRLDESDSSRPCNLRPSLFIDRDQRGTRGFIQKRSPSSGEIPCGRMHSKWVFIVKEVVKLQTMNGIISREHYSSRNQWY